MFVNRTLVKDAQTKAGGRVHMAVQWTTLYEFAVARYHHRNTKPMELHLIEKEIRDLEEKLYALTQ